MDPDCRVDGARAVAFIDSGAEISIANTHLFAQLAKQGASYLSDVPIALFGVTGGSAEGRLMSVAKIRLGSLTFTNVLLVICDLEVFGAWSLSDRPALFIGMNLLQKMSMVTIDYGRKELLFKLAQIAVALGLAVTILAAGAMRTDKTPAGEPLSAETSAPEDPCEINSG